MKKQIIKNKILSEKGGATVLVFFTVFTFLIVGMGAYMAVSILRKSQDNSDIRIQEIYGQDVGRVDTVYDELILANRSELESFKISGEYATEKKTLVDKYKNRVTIPYGFKVASDSGIDVTEGVVIEDNDITTDGKGNKRGNQYVWVPVGKINKSDGTIETITLGRYTFDVGTYDETTKKYDGTGKPTLEQNAVNYADETEIIPSSTATYGFKELVISKKGVASSGTDGLNTTALNLEEFINSVNSNGGYYIARYEASYGIDGKANSKVSSGVPPTSNPTTRTEGMLWNFINQIDAAEACRYIYGQDNNFITTDLINSYAWDTAINYIQMFSGNNMYSKQVTLNTTLANTGNLGTSIIDEKCKINDMASNLNEWTTENSGNIRDSSAYPCPIRGGYYNNIKYTSASRSSYRSSTSVDYSGFRLILYLK